MGEGPSLLYMACRQVVKSPFPETRPSLSPDAQATTHLGDSSVLLHQQGRPTVRWQGLPIVAADAAEKRVENAPAPGLLRSR